MNFRLTTAALLILVILAGLVFYMTTLAPPPHAKKVHGQVFNPKPKTIARITVRRSGHIAKEFVRAGTHWKIVHPMAAWGRDFKIGDIGDTLRALTYKYRVAIQPTGPHAAKALGLAPPRAVVTLTDDAGKAFTLNVGRHLVNGRLYVQSAGQKHWAQVVHAGWFGRLQQPITKFRDRNLTRFHLKNVNGIFIRQGAGLIRIERIQSRWIITQPVHAPARPTAVSNWLSNLQSLHAHGFSSVPPGIAGLNQPVASVGVSLVAPTSQPGKKPGKKSLPLRSALQVKFGRYTDLTRQRVYTSSNQDPGTAVLNALSMSHLVKSLAQMRDHALTQAAVGKANRIVIVRRAGLLSPEVSAPLFPRLYLMQSPQGSWRMGTTPTQFAGGPLLRASTQAVVAMTAALKKLRAKEFIDVKPNLSALGLQPPLASLVLTIPGRIHPCHIWIGQRQKSGLLPMQRTSWPSVYLVASWKVAALLPQATALRSRRVASISGQSIESMKVRQRLLRHSVGVTQQNGQWKVTKLQGVASVPEETKNAAALAAALGHLQAKRWIRITPPKMVPQVIQIKLIMAKALTPTAPTVGKVKMPAVGPQKPALVRATLDLWPPLQKKTGATWQAVYEVTGTRENWVFQPSAQLVKAAQAVLVIAKPKAQKSAAKAAPAAH